MYFIKNSRGSITPSFVIIVMLMMIVGSYFFCLMKIYENRLVVRDAVDAAVTSALASGAETREKATYYYEYQVCPPAPEDGPAPPCYWVPEQGRNQKYIAIKPALAQETAHDFMVLNLKNNTKGYKLKRFVVTMTYDQGRYIEVESDRENTSTPYSWWSTEFGDSSPPALTGVSTRMVRFPRWAKVDIEATVEMEIPLGQLLGHPTMEFTWKADAVKELKDVSN